MRLLNVIRAAVGDKGEPVQLRDVLLSSMLERAERERREEEEEVDPAEWIAWAESIARDTGGAVVRLSDNDPGA